MWLWCGAFKKITLRSHSQVHNLKPCKELWLKKLWFLLQCLQEFSVLELNGCKPSVRILLTLVLRMWIGCVWKGNARASVHARYAAQRRHWKKPQRPYCIQWRDPAEPLAVSFFFCMNQTSLVIQGVLPALLDLPKLCQLNRAHPSMQR